MILIKTEEVEGVLRRVFGTDEDLYTRRQHGSVKTLDGLVEYAMGNLFDGGYEISVYTYGDEYGFFAVADKERVLLSFGIKKQHRDKKDMFWTALEEILGGSYYAALWSENRNARRFFEQHDGRVFVEREDMVIYEFKK